MDLYKNWACLLSAHGHGSVRLILQSPSGFIFILFNCPLHPFWSVVIEKKGQLGWQLKNYRLTVQCSWVDGWNDWVDGSMFMGWRLKWLGWQWQRQWVDGWKRRGRQVYKHLTSCPKALMTHDTCRFTIGFYLGSKHHFVFCALLL